MKNKKLIGLFLGFVIAALVALKADFEKPDAPAPMPPPVAADAGVK
jgi:hypothetical protein